MFSSLGTKLAMKKLGIPSDLTKSSPFRGEAAPNDNKGASNKSFMNLDEEDKAANASAWPKWMSVKNLPLTVQPWFSPVPPPVPVAAECPKVGEPAPVDTDQKLMLGGDGKKVIVVFLRCVGCACKSTSVPPPPGILSLSESHHHGSNSQSQLLKKPSFPCAPSQINTSSTT